jgi:recombination protein RecR
MQIRELILATNPNVEGEATAMFIARMVQPLGIKTTRIARGLPSGGDVEYADALTLANALSNRRDFS